MIISPTSRDDLNEIVDLTDNEIRFNVIKILEYVIDEVRYEVHVRYLSDGFSIPRFLKFAFRALFKRIPLLIFAAILHDYLYSKSRDLSKSCKAEADQIFYRLMRHYGANWLTSKLFLSAVRAFGGVFYRKRYDINHPPINKNENH